MRAATIVSNPFRQHPKEGETPKTPTEMMKDSISESLDVFDGNNPETADRDCICICAREKTELGEYRYSTITIPTKEYSTNLVNVVLANFKKMPTIILDDKAATVETVRRVLTNLNFS